MKHASLTTAMALSASLVALPAFAQSTTHSTTTPMAGQTMGAGQTSGSGQTTGMGSNANGSSSNGANTTTSGGLSGMMSGSNDTYMSADGQIRASKVVGADVYNDKNDKIGSVYDVLMHKDGSAASVVVSVGGFLGIDAKYVDVPYGKLDIKANKIVMPGASKQTLTDLPTYHYSKS